MIQKRKARKEKIGLTRREKIERLEELKADRVALREAKRNLLAGKAQSYSIGSRSLTRYAVTLDQIRADMEWVDEKIAELSADISGHGRRLGYVFTPRG